MARIDRLGQQVHGDEYVPETDEARQDAAYRDDADRLRDPDVQARILAEPDRDRFQMRLVLQDAKGDEYERVIYVPMQLTKAQIERRGVLDMVEATTKVLFLELQRFTPDGQRPSEEWMNRNPGYIDAAFAVKRVRDLARELLSLVAYEMREPPADAKPGTPPTRVPVTVAEIGEQIPPLLLFGAVMAFIRRVTDEMNARKNGEAATGQESGQPSSSRPSSTTTRALRRRRLRT